MRILVLFFVTLSCSAYAFKYPVSEIPDSLKNNAFAVVREDSTVYELLSQNVTRVTIKKAVTILSENGKSQGYYFLNYDKNRKINSIVVNFYNSFGIKEDEKLRKDFDDVAADPYGTTYTDARSLSGKFFSNKYPYTIEILATYELNNTYLFPKWISVDDYNLSVQKAALTVRYVGELKFNYLEKGFFEDVNKTQYANQITWQIRNFKAIKQIPFNPDIEELVPVVLLSPSKFYFEGYGGETSSWKSFGEFFLKLNEGRDILSEDLIAKIKKIADTCKTNKDKVKCLYKYMQSHTRYISIQKGIGGIQPISAQTVANTGYGDCKALSNYMKSILKYAGVNSYYTLVNGGSKDYSFDLNFVHDYFNHVILCVPLETDTIWLECTNQTSPFGFMGSFTDDRIALLVKEDCSELRHTPIYNKDKNTITRKCKINVLPDRVGTASIVSYYSGLEYDERHNIAINDQEEQKKLITENLKIQDFIINNFNCSATDGPDPVLKEELKLTLNNYYSITGNRLFLPLNLLDKLTYIPQRLDKREVAIFNDYEFTYIDSVVYELPEDYEIEALPKDLELNTSYGTYSTMLILNGKDLTYIRKLQLNIGRYPASEYESFIAFFSKIRNNDKSMLVLKNNR